ncbi:hypothetical protein ACLOJK_025396 [Asimina triloba]
MFPPNLQLLSSLALLKVSTPGNFQSLRFLSRPNILAIPHKPSPKMSSCFSLVSLYSIYLRRLFLSAGLRPRTIQIDSQTTLHCWLPLSPSINPPLLLIHGFGPSPTWQWRYQIRSLSRHFSLYIPDLLFFGASTTASSDRSEVFQAASLAKMMEKLGVHRFSAVGTSYGGFVAYHLARICGDRLEKVVIASSGVNKRRRDNEELMEKAGVQRVSNLLLPATAKELRTLLRLSVRRVPYVPDCLLNDVIRVSDGALPFFSSPRTTVLIFVVRFLGHAFR